MRPIGLLLLLVWCTGCSSIMGTMFKEQAWSENYVLEAGTEADVPEIIDGDTETIGKLKVPREARPNLGYSVIPTADATITLAAEKYIAKIVIYTDKMDGVQVHAYDKGRDDWKLIKDVKGNLPPKLEIRTSVRTSKIRLKSRAVPERGSTSTFGRRFSAGPRDVAAPTLREIELYGLVEI